MQVVEASRGPFVGEAASSADCLWHSAGPATGGIFVELKIT